MASSNHLACAVIAVLAAIPIFAGLAAADPVLVDRSTFSGSETVIDFDELTHGEMISATEYASHGVEIVGNLWAAISSAWNLDPGNPDSCRRGRGQNGGCLPVELVFSPPVTRVGLDLHVGNEETVTLIAESNGTQLSISHVRGGFWGFEERESGIESLYIFALGQPIAIDDLRLDFGPNCEELSTDADGDGHYTPDSCLEPHDDCDDDDASVHPGHAELCDGVDNDCDDVVPELTAGKAKGGGKLEGVDGRVSYGFDAEREHEGELPKGKLKYHNHDTGLKGKGEVEELLLCEDGSAVVSGSCGEEVGRCRFAVSIESEQP